MITELVSKIHSKAFFFFALFSEDNLRRRFCSELSYKSWLEEKILRSSLLPMYQKKKESYSTGKDVYFMSDDYWVSGGVCDKLRGIVSLYSICTQLKLNFKIYWTYPFNLNDYLIPNEYDWLSQDAIERSTNSLPIQVMSYRHYSDGKEMAFQQKLLRANIKRNRKLGQIHVYTNAHFGNSDFFRIFHVLFKPSPRLQLLIDKYIPTDYPYISMSFRFLQLLGDFKDRSGGDCLSEIEKQEYLQASLDLIEKKHLECLSMKILVASDSNMLLEAARKFEFVFVIPGKPKHSDLPSDNFDKELLDFYAISKAQSVYLCRKGKMYSSGFPYYASLMGNKPFETIEY